MSVFTGTILVSEHVTHVTVAGKAVLLDTQSGRYLGLNEIATRIWQLATEHRTREQVLSILGSEYSVSKDVLTKDVGEFLNECCRRRLLTYTRSRKARGKGV